MTQLIIIYINECSLIVISKENTLSKVLERSWYLSIIPFHVFINLGAGIIVTTLTLTKGGTIYASAISSNFQVKHCFLLVSQVKWHLLIKCPKYKLRFHAELVMRKLCLPYHFEQFR